MARLSKSRSGVFLLLKNEQARSALPDGFYESQHKNYDKLPQGSSGCTDEIDGCAA
jgi:hypothetical protein